MFSLRCSLLQFCDSSALGQGSENTLLILSFSSSLFHCLIYFYQISLSLIFYILLLLRFLLFMFIYYYYYFCDSINVFSSLFIFLMIISMICTNAAQFNKVVRSEFAHKCIKKDIKYESFRRVVRQSSITIIL